MTRKQKPQSLNDVLSNLNVTASVTTPNAPVNASTGREYKNGNRETLLQAATAKGFTSHEWATMKQWNNIHYSIAKRQKGTLIRFTILQPQDGGLIETTETAFVFNRCQLAEPKPLAKTKA